MRRRRVLVTVAAAVAAPALATGARAQAFPSKPIRILIPFAPGGTSDILARLLQPHLQAALGQSVVVENRTGAAGNIGVEAAIEAEPDGYTLLFGTMGAMTTNPHLYDVDFDPATDLVPISKTFEVDHVLVMHPDVPADTVQELIALAKERPGELTYGSAGIGSSVQMFMVMLEQRAGIEMQQVPYNGSAPARVDTVAGNIDMVMDSVPSAQEHIAAGDLKALAVTAGERNEALPDIPTMMEAGIDDYAAVAWGALLAPKGTPQEVIDRLSEATQAALANPDVVEAYKKSGLDPVSSTPEELAQLIHDDTERWGEIVREAGITIE